MTKTTCPNSTAQYGRRNSLQQVEHIGLLGRGLLFRWKKNAGGANQDAIQLAPFDGHAVVEAFWPSSGSSAEASVFVVCDRRAIEELALDNAVGLHCAVVAYGRSADRNPKGILPFEGRADAALGNLVGAVRGADIAFSDLAVSRVAPSAHPPVCRIKFTSRTIRPSTGR
ncbi:hypothetical protein I5535_10675 [Rhodobacteraceae bacterium F11138]|nr:hypothetical protein [Rhodobacteraceae bacterium F11138]